MSNFELTIHIFVLVVVIIIVVIAEFVVDRAATGVAYYAGRPSGRVFDRALRHSLSGGASRRCRNVGHQLLVFDEDSVLELGRRGKTRFVAEVHVENKLCHQFVAKNRLKKNKCY